MNWLIDISNKYPLSVLFTAASIASLLLWAQTERIIDRKRRILTLLIQEPEMYGRQIVRADPRTQGLTTIYILLNSMEEGGLITSYGEKHPHPSVNIPRRIYSITDAGRQWLNDHPPKKSTAYPS